MILENKNYSVLSEDAKNRFYIYIQLDEIRSEYESIDCELLKPTIDYISVNYKEGKDDLYVFNLSVTSDIFYKDSNVPCGYYKLFYSLNEFNNEFECIDEIFNLFIDDFQF
jgi:hypothetical protein